MACVRSMAQSVAIVQATTVRPPPVARQTRRREAKACAAAYPANSASP